MAIINCPSCNQPISNKAKLCSHCGLAIGEMDEESIKRQRYLQKLNKSQNITMQSIVAMLLFVGGFAYTFWNGDVKSEWSLMLGYISVGIGLIWYLINRVRLVLLKRKND